MGNVLTFVCLFVSRITTEVIGGFFCEIWAVGRLWTKEELNFGLD